MSWNEDPWPPRETKLTGIILPKPVDKLESRVMTGQMKADTNSTILLDGGKFLRVPDMHTVWLWKPE